MSDFKGYIEVTEIDPRLLVQVAFSGSRPQGLGFIHHRPGGLDEETLNEIIERSKEARVPGEIDLDYVHGRSMKFHVRVDAETGKRYIDLDWYDHSREATKHLVRECGLPDVEARIAQAEAEKAEKEREWAARQDKAARALVKIMSERGGRANALAPPFSTYFTLPDTDPLCEAWMYGRQPAVKAGWVTVDRDWREYTLTDAGRALLVEQAA